MSKIVSITLRVALWIVSILIALIGLICLGFGMTVPIQTASLQWDGWANIDWDFAETGLIMLLFGIAICPLVSRVGRHRLGGARNYILVVCAALALGEGAVTWIQSSTGYLDYKKANAEQDSAKRLALYVKAAEKGNMEAAMEAAVIYGDAKPAQEYEFLQRAVAAGSPDGEIDLAEMYIYATGPAGEPPLQERRARATRLLLLAADAPDNLERSRAADTFDVICKLPRVDVPQCKKDAAALHAKVAALAKADGDDDDTSTDPAGFLGGMFGAPDHSADIAKQFDAANTAQTAPTKSSPQATPDDDADARQTAIAGAAFGAAAGAAAAAKQNNATNAAGNASVNASPQPAPATASTPAPALSPECAAKKSLSQKMICADPALAALDVRLQALYRRATSGAADPTTLQADQAQWLDERNACRNAACLQTSYRRRIADINRWISQ